jgi:regulator of RNase E activity RraA
VRSTVLSIVRSSLVALLAVGLMNLPTMAASTTPLETVVTAQNARLDNVNAAIGAAVCSGDAISTDKQGWFAKDDARSQPTASPL